MIRKSEKVHNRNRSSKLIFALLINRYILLFMLNFSFLFTLSAQNSKGGIPYIKNYKKSEYNAATQNWAIIQDKRGVIYLGNNDGVLEFDGMNWTTYPTSNFSVVRSLAIDKDEKIWVGAYNEIGYLHADKTGKTKYVSITNLIPDKYKNFSEVWKIHISTHGIYFQSFVTIFYYDYEKIEVIGGYNDYQFSFYLDNRFFIQDRVKGLMELRGKKLFLIEGGEIFVNPIEIWSMLRLDNDRTLIATQQDGLFVYDGYKISKYELKIEKFLIENQVFSSLKLANGNFLFGTIQNGIVITNQKGELIQHINKDKGLQNNTILSMFVDISGQLWLGLDNGIDYVEINSAFSYINDGCGIDGTGYTAKLYNGYLYLGTNQGLYYKKWNTNEEKNIDPGKFKLIEKTKGQVWNLYVYDETLFCGHNQGTFIISDNKAEKISDEIGAWMFIETELPNKIIGGTYTSLISFNKDKSNSWSFGKKYEKLHESCRVLAIDSLNNLWISHEYKGIIKVNFSSNYEKINSYKLYNSNDGFHSDFDIYVYKFNNDLIFCTDKGIYQFNYLTDRFYRSPKYDHIFGKQSKIRIPKTDKNGNIWFYKNNRLVVLKRKTDSTYINNEGVFSRFEKSYMESFENLEFIDSSSILIGTDAGFVHYNNINTNTANNTFQVIINSVKLTKPTDSIIWYGNVSGQKDFSNVTRLPYQMNALKFEFVLPFYEGIERTKYRFKLEGFDKNWSQWKVINKKEYTNLAPGKYTFNVMAKNIFDQISKETQYHFRILPPWYRTIRAYIFYLILSAISIALATKFLIIRIQLEKRKLERKQQMELKEKEEKYAREVLIAEQQITQLENEKLQIEVEKKRSEMELKNKELASVAIQIYHKDEMLTKLKKSLEAVSKNINPESRIELNQLIRTIDSDIKLDEDWNNFTKHFEEVHYGFFKYLKEKYPLLTPKDLKMCAYLRINLSTKEIAPLLNISVRGVEISRYRIRKKLGIDKDTNLIEFMLDI